MYLWCGSCVLWLSDSLSWCLSFFVVSQLLGPALGYITPKVLGRCSLSLRLHSSCYAPFRIFALACKLVAMYAAPRGQVSGSGHLHCSCRAPSPNLNTFIETHCCVRSLSVHGTPGPVAVTATVTHGSSTNSCLCSLSLKLRSGAAI